MSEGNKSLDLDLGKIVAEAEASAAPLPKGSGPTVHDVRQYAMADDYDPGPTPAMVGGRVGFKSSKNFQSITLEVEVLVPSLPTMEEMAARSALASDMAFAVLNEHAPRLKKLSQALGMGKMPPTVDLEGEAEEVIAAIRTVRQGAGGRVMRIKRKKDKDDG